MEKKSVLKSITAGKEYPNRFNPAEMMYPWNLEWENGDKGQINTKKNEAPYVVGQEYPYDITEGAWPDGTKKFVIKKVDPNNKQFKKADPTIKLRTFAISYANRFVTQDIIPRPAEDKLQEESNEDWNKFLTILSSYSKLFYKEMLFDLNLYGGQYADVIGVAMSNAIDARLHKKIRKDMIFPFYRNLLEAVLDKPQQTEQK